MSELIDNRAHRISVLKEIIQHLHAGASPDLVKERLRNIVGETDATEIMAMEQQLMAEGMPVEEVRSMCDLHSQVTRDALVQVAPPVSIQPGHPVDTFRRENTALKHVIATMRGIFAEIANLEGSADVKEVVLRLRQSANDLMDLDKHYQRKEHALFSCLERHGITGPSKVMWAKDDDVRKLLKQMNQEAHDCGPTAAEASRFFNQTAAPALSAVEEMIFKEEHILFPMSLQMLTENEWAEIWSASPQYGWCLVEPQTGYAPPVTAGATTGTVPRDGTIMMSTGHVSVEQLTAVLSTLPLDLTFVDAEDRVAFFSEGPDRIFARSKAIIGRKVQHCHPPRSADTVNKILEDFRSGRENVAEFWINFHGKFVHIRYFAVRDKQGDYLGTVELTQDIAPLRGLQGEKRLLSVQ
ncbi:MAG TPA: DUF438 domain-containing protein [Candidatus Dormibacteraeota bacterium]|nr:DUF438 domain-containing protein [Candidatus Dormibacteraeota bacterium]